MQEKEEIEMTIFTIILVAIYIVSFFCDTSFLGYYSGCPWYNYITYMFIHTNIIHLFSNCALMNVMWKRVAPYNRKITIPIFAVASVVSPMLSSYNIPTIGVSAFIMSLSGFYVSLFSRTDIIKTMAIFFASFLLTYLLLHNINTLVHLYSYIISFVLGSLARRFRCL